MAYQQEAEQWEKEKQQFLAQSGGGRSYFSQKDYDTLQSLTFDQFYKEYTGRKIAGGGDAQTMGALGSLIYVGHVAIVERDPAGTLWIVEALSGQGVVHTKYKDWLAARQGQLFWYGRLDGVARDKRAQIAAEAKNILGQNTISGILIC